MNTKIKVLIVFGTRPEAIKMAPIVHSLKSGARSIDVKVCLTGQHRSMLDQVMDFFELESDYDLDVMSPGQSLTGLSAKIMNGLQEIINVDKPDFIFVHGDTTTSFITSLVAYYNQIKVCHIEAGLRTWNKLAPFPEEINRQLTARIADFHFAPTSRSKENLLSENIKESSVFVTGNTVIDALKWTLKKVEDRSYVNEEINLLKEIISTFNDHKIVLVTGHRRENFGNGFEEITDALKRLSTIPGTLIIYPVHLNPNIKKIVHRKLDNIDNVKLIDPLDYPAFVWLMNKASILLTDSGGIQEEGPSIGKPVLVMREVTERIEALEAGTIKLVGTNPEVIFSECERILKDKSILEIKNSPYGDGTAAEKIRDILLEIINGG